MADGNGDYLSRFERMAQILERVSSNLTTLVQVQRMQADNWARFADGLGRHDVALFEIEAKLNALNQYRGLRHKGWSAEGAQPS